MAEAFLIGIMSGTSADGADAALVHWARGKRPGLVAHLCRPYPAELQAEVLALQAPGVDEVERVGLLHSRLGLFYAELTQELLAQSEIAAEDIAVIGMHGQTIRHRPRARYPFSLQIGSAAVLAERTGCTVAFDFRSRDIAAGGEGAPLTPWAHRIFFSEQDEDIAVLNLGGVANITFLGAQGELIGFDCGPANAPLDALMLALSDGRTRVDQNGELAAQGRVDEALLQALCAHPFLRRPPPKSADKHDFLGAWLDRLLAAEGLCDADRLATAAEWVAASVAEAQRFLPRRPARWIVCGGGVHNRHLMQRLRARLAPAAVVPSDRLGMPAAAVEAASFALLAWHAVLGRPNTAPEVTGAARAVVGGALVPGENWPQLLRLRAQWTR